MRLSERLKSCGFTKHLASDDVDAAAEICAAAEILYVEQVAVAQSYGKEPANSEAQDRRNCAMDALLALVKEHSC